MVKGADKVILRNRTVQVIVLNRADQVILLNRTDQVIVLNRADHVILLRLRTGHDRLNPHLFNQMKI